MCEHCKKEHFTICLNGALWLCWGCYVLVLREEKGNAG